MNYKRYTKRHMILSFIICGLVMILFTACNKTNVDPNQTSTTSTYETVVSSTTTATSTITTASSSQTETTIIEVEKQYVVGDIPDILSPVKRPQKLDEPNIINYDLGTEFIDENGKEVPYRVQGILGVPKGEGKYPLVVIMHGSHPVNSIDDLVNNRYDLGFEYLVKELASYGFATISINVNLEYAFLYGEPVGYERLNKIFDLQLDKLTQAVNGTDQGFGIDISNKIDLEYISLIGHSRSGQGVYSIIEDQKLKGMNNIKNLLLVAPANFMIMDMNEDVNTGIIIPELDGDVNLLDGQSMFDELRKDETRTTSSSLVYLYGANHNFFNNMLEPDDANKIAQNSDRLTKENQQDFLKQYTVDFLLSSKKPVISGIGLNSKETTPGELYGYKVLTSLSNNGSKIILRPENENDINMNLLGSNNIFTDMKATYMVDSSFYKEDSGPFEHPGRPKYIGLLNLEWEKKDASLKIEFPENNNDFSDFSSLSLYIAVDPSNQLNQMNEDQTFTIRISDNEGNLSNVLIDRSAPMMRYTKGELIKNEYGDYWSTFTPLSSLRIPLEYFKGIDLSSIESIELIFDQSESGALMIGEISLIK